MLPNGNQSGGTRGRGMAPPAPAPPAPATPTRRGTPLFQTPASVFASAPNEGQSTGASGRKKDRRRGQNNASTPLNAEGIIEVGK